MTTSEEYKIEMKERLNQAVKEEEKKITGFFIKNHRFTYLILFAIIAFGFYSLMVLPREANPEVKVPFAVVTTVLPGATPVDMEELVTNEIEADIENLDKLRRYTSSSGQGFSSIFVEFDADANLDESYRKLREAVDRSKSGLPAEALDPVVSEISFSDIPIVTYSLVGDFSDQELKNLADVMQGRFENIPNVSKVPVLGGLTREFQVIVDQTKLVNYNISLSQVIAAIQRTNFNLPAGDIEIDGFTYNVRVEGKFTEADTLNNVVITTFDATPIYIRDVANVKDTFKEKKTESRIGFAGETPRNTVSLQIFKKTGGNILDIVEQSQMLIAELQQDGTIPADVAVQKTNDNSVFIKDDLNRLGKSGIQTMILIVLILLVVLSFRGAFITGLSVPIAFLISFTFLNVSGQTLNGLVLFSLVLSLGLMVDNSIVIIEGINEYISEHNKSIYEAAILSVWNFKWPIIAGTMTTVAAFLPLLLVSGILGEFLKVMPITITATLLSSLFVAIIVIPTLFTRWLKLKQTNGGQSHRHQKRHNIVKNIRSYIIVHYESLLRRLLPNKKLRRLLITASWVLFLISLAIPATGLMKIEMFGAVDVEYFVISIELPVGSNLEATKNITGEVEKIVADIPETDNYVTNLGTSVSLGLQDEGGGTDNTHLASITVNLKDASERNRKSFEIAESLRPQLEAVQNAKVTIQELSAGPPTGSPVEVRIFGDDIAELTRLAGIIKDYFKNVPGIINIRDSLQESTGDFTFKIDKEKADFYGLSVAAIATNLRTAVFGTEASTVTLGGDDVDITVKYDQDKFTKIEDLENILIFTPRGESIPIKQVASLSLEPSLLSIGHRDGQKVVIVRADTEEKVNITKVFDDFGQYQKTLELPKDYKIGVGGEVEDIEQSFREAFLSMIIAVILISFILVLQFNSFRQPFIILFTLPLAIIGVLIGLNVLRMTFSFTVFIGLVALSGIVVNDAIVLIDRINKNLVYGLEFTESIIEAGIARMQPIFLTTLTTVAGVFPLVFADELWRGLAVTVIFGLIFSTILTLIMVPVMFVGLCRKEKCID